MGVYVQFPDGSMHWDETKADPNPNGGSVVDQSGNVVAGANRQSGSTGPGGNGVSGTQANPNGSFKGNPYGSQSSGGPAAPSMNTAAPPTGPSGGPSSPAQPGYTNLGSQWDNMFKGNVSPAMQSEWEYDPTQPARATRNAMRLLGLPTFGPMGDFSQSYGQQGIAQLIAGGGGGDMTNPQGVLNALQNRFANGGGGDRNTLLGNLGSAEDTANSLLGSGSTNIAALYQKFLGGDQQAGQQLAGMFGGDLNKALRAAYVTQLEGDPAAEANLYTGAMTGSGLSTTMAGLLSSFLGRGLQTQVDQGVNANRGFGFLNSLFGVK